MSAVQKAAAHFALFSADPSLQQFFAELLAEAGIVINGTAPSALYLNSFDVPEQLFIHDHQGFAEAYSNGYWDALCVDEFFYRLFSVNIPVKVQAEPRLFPALKAWLFTSQSAVRAGPPGRHPYLGHDFYKAMLGSPMSYTCGDWTESHTLEQAQHRHFDLICLKLNLQPGMKVLDLGCGWGSFMAYAAQYYGVRCIGVTTSVQQAQWVNAKFSHLPVYARVQDYHNLYEPFDAIVSIDAAGDPAVQHCSLLMQVAHNCLKPNGLFLLETIGKPEDPGYLSPLIDSYLFPNAEIPSYTKLSGVVSPCLKTEEMQNLSEDFDKTLMAWQKNFERAWPDGATQLATCFYRLWRYDLLFCAAAFRARELQLWQLLFSKEI